MSFLQLDRPVQDNRYGVAQLMDHVNVGTTLDVLRRCSMDRCGPQRKTSAANCSQSFTTRATPVRSLADTIGVRVPQVFEEMLQVNSGLAHVGILSRRGLVRRTRTSQQGRRKDYRWQADGQAD